MSTNRFGSFKNKYGHFTEDGFEFVVTRPDTPRPWTNIISNGDYGLVISQAGGGFSWRTHVSLNRLTRWNQDLIRDDWGKWLYLRDMENGQLRSLAFQPMQADYDSYQVRHGLGYTIFEQKKDDLETEWTVMAAMNDPVEIWKVSLKNRGNRQRKFQLSSYLEWNLGAAPDVNREFHKIFIETGYDAASHAILATKTLWEVPTKRGHWNSEWPYAGFHAVNEQVSGWDTSKDALIGRHGGFHNPRGIAEGKFTGSQGRFHDAVASLAVDITLEPGEEKTVVWLLGQVDLETMQDAKKKIAALIQRYGNAEDADSELLDIKRYWKTLTDQIRIETPHPSFDLLSNIWLKYQAISGHMWARTGYYQQSGAYGYRDQLQTSQVWLPIEPDRMLEHARLNARHQFKKGTVLHWWHPLTEQGLATNMTDDLLWLPFLLSKYLKETAEFSVLGDVLPFYDEGEATLQDHCTRAIDVVLDRMSDRGLPLIGEGDWCDGFSAVGLDWKGESIWLGMFLYDILVTWSGILEKFSPIRDVVTATHYRTRADRLKEALNAHAWNGYWYLAATKDDGTPIGDPSQKECKIYLMSQTWAIISGVAEGERREKIARAILDQLEGENGFMLFHPAFSTPDRFIGYITRYAPGVRENGGVYTHASTWGVQALAKMGWANDAMRIFDKLNPILQSQRNPDHYSAEPYVLPGNIDGKDSEFYGRAGWSWYTGSAGWLFTIAHEAICGVRPLPEGLQIDPSIPEDWPELKITRKFRGAVYNIHLKNPHKKSGGVRSVDLNGQIIAGNIIPPQAPGTYDVKIVLE